MIMISYKVKQKQYLPKDNDILQGQNQFPPKNNDILQGQKQYPPKDNDILQGQTKTISIKG